MNDLLISIVIPTLNEVESLPTVIASCLQAEDVEVIVVDGGSTDGTPELALQMGVRLLTSKPGRATQMNKGARGARGGILLFLHGDTILPEDYFGQITETLGQSGAIAGAFQLSISSEPFSMRLIERAVNFRSRFLQMPYGDQGLFLEKSTFEQVGGFREVPIMEDFEFVRALRRLGRIAIAEAPVLTSGRRWERQGPLKTTIVNQIAIGAHLLGVPPGRIAKFYNRFSST
jgi:rSAM/selenodomain-associated transferase 2